MVCGGFLKVDIITQAGDFGIEVIGGLFNVAALPAALVMPDTFFLPIMFLR